MKTIGSIGRMIGTRGLGHFGVALSLALLLVAGSAGVGNEARAAEETLAQSLGLAHDGDTIVRGGCWSCNFVTVFLYAGDAFARETYHILAGGIVGSGGPGLIHYLFGLWILLQGSRLFFPGIADEPGNVLKAVALRGLLYTVVIGMLTSYGSGTSSVAGGNVFFDWGPYMALNVGGNTAAHITGEFRGITGHGGLIEEGAECGAVDLDKIKRIVTTDEFGGNILSIHDYRGDVKAETGTDPVESLMCSIHNMQSVSGTGLMVAFYMLSQGGAGGENTLDVTGIWFVDEVLTGFAQLFYIILGSVVLALIFGIALVAVPFYFIDVLIRLFLVAAFGPILITAVLFKPTRGMAVTSVKLMLGACMNLIGLAIVAGLATTMMRVAPLFVRKDGGGTYDNLNSMLVGMGTGEVHGVFGFGNTGYWIFLMGGILLLLLLKKVSSMVSGVFGDNANFGTNMGSAAAGLAKTAGLGAVAVGGLVVGGTGMYAAKGASQVVGGKAGQAWGAMGGMTGIGQRVGSLTRAFNPNNTDQNIQS